MWISSLELTNFKSYQRAVLEFPQPENGENIVLIGGMNGYGKTSILEAIYLCLYGKEAIPHLARAGLKADDTRGYPSFLEKAFNGEAKISGKDIMSVRMLISFSKTEAVDIQRRWYFRSNGTWTRDEEAVIKEIHRGVPSVPRKDGMANFSLNEYLDEKFVPAHIAPFFFFDGEEVKKLADQERIETVKQGLEQLLGVVLLRELANRLVGFESNKRSSVTSVNIDKVNELAEEIATLEKSINALRAESASSAEKLRALSLQRISLIDRLTAAGGGRGDVAALKDLVEEREGYRSALRDVQKKLEKILADKLPFHLVPSQLVQQFKTQLRKESALEAWNAERKNFEQKVDRFTEAFLKIEEPRIDPPLIEQQISPVRERIKKAWESLFHPPPEHCAERFVHDYLSEQQRQKTLAFLDSFSVGQQDIHDLLSQQQNLRKLDEDLTRKIVRVEGIDADGTLQELKRQLAQVDTHVNEAEAKLRENERAIGGLDVTLSNVKASYAREKEALEKSSPVLTLISKSERVRQVIDAVVPELFPLKVKSLSAAMTRVYKQLAHKKQVSEIVIENDGATKIIGRSGREISVDRSAGENQIFATALIAGLAEVSGVKAPLVVDTPLGRLDSKHRENIFNFWISNPTRQVILLSQDKEIDAEFYSKIEHNVCATYLLSHTDIGEDIGRTTVRAGKYFGE
jgi:DNA sulfur modification protein DndD